ncbi:hypothetical protein ACHAW6_007461 [Cyclotella cf. meneghiniana]
MGCLETYDLAFKLLISRHCLIEKVNNAQLLSSPQLIQQCSSMPNSKFMIQAEKLYQKLKSGHIPFSLEIGTWIKHTLFYCSLLQFLADHTKNTRIYADKHSATKSAIPFNSLSHPFTFASQNVKEVAVLHKAQAKI